MLDRRHLHMLNMGLLLRAQLALVSRCARAFPRAEPELASLHVEQVPLSLLRTLRRFINLTLRIGDAASHESQKKHRCWYSS